MSTKELYEAHALINKNKAADQFAYNLVDEAIEKYIEAERYLQMHLKRAYEYTAGSEPDEQDLQEIYRERFKTVICRRAASKDVPVIPDGSEMEQLQFLADYHGCPRANWK